MSLDEYLRASFDGAGRDFVDGEVLERNVGELPHAAVQMELAYRLRNLAPTTGLTVLPEIRIQVAATRFRVADVAVWLARPSGTRIPIAPPFLVIEVLSAEDPLVRLQPKTQDYLKHGVRWLSEGGPEGPPLPATSYQLPATG